jgi:hypothetical protein
MLAAETDAYIAAGHHRLATVASLPGLVYGLRSIRETKGTGHIAPWTSLHYVFLKSPVFTGGSEPGRDAGVTLILSCRFSTATGLDMQPAIWTDSLTARLVECRIA